MMFHWLFLMLAMSFSQAGPLLSSKPVSFHSNDCDDPVVQHQQLKQSDPEVFPGLWQGDIALSPHDYHSWRLGLKFDVFPNRKWLNGIVPYQISYKYSPVDRETIQTAIYTIGLMTCIHFIPYDGIVKDYLLILPVEEPSGSQIIECKRCWSYIGRQGGQQVLSLEPPDKQGPKCLGGPGKAIHELLHALGIFHEQSRADRDNYVVFVPEHVASKSFLRNFDKESPINTTYSYPYDYDSIMHYGTHFFSSRLDEPTLVPKRRGAQIGQRIGLSRIDCYKVNKLYGCFDRSSYEKQKYQSFCDILGL